MKRKALLALLCCIPFLSGCSTISEDVYPNAEKYVVGSTTYDKEVTAISVSWHCGELTLVEDSSIKGASLVEENNLLDPLKVHSYYEDGGLDVRFFESGFTSRIDPKDKKLTITYNPNLSYLNINITSGNVYAYALTAKKLGINMTSGTAIIGSVIAEESNLKFTSGSLTISAFRSPKATLNYTSGNVKIDSIESDSFEAEGTSGDSTFIFKSLKEGKMKLTSGSLDIKVPEAGASVSIDKTSGSIETRREHHVIDGIYVFGDGSSKLAVKLTSGTIYLS